MVLTSNQLYALCAEAKVDQKTGKNWLNPAYRPRMKPVVRARLVEAANKLGISQPTTEGR